MEGVKKQLRQECFSFGEGLFFQTLSGAVDSKMIAKAPTPKQMKKVARW